MVWSRLWWKNVLRFVFIRLLQTHLTEFFNDAPLADNIWLINILVFQKLLRKMGLKKNTSSLKHLMVKPLSLKGHTLRKFIENSINIRPEGLRRKWILRNEIGVLKISWGH